MLPAPISVIREEERLGEDVRGDKEGKGAVKVISTTCVNFKKKIVVRCKVKKHGVGGTYK